MLSKIDFLTLFLLVSIISSAINLANANSKSVCPTRNHDNIHQIDIFDGKPEELAYLAPDDEQTAPNTYTLGYIYEKGRRVTIRCKYNSGFVFDVELKNKVNECKLSSYKSGEYALVCK
jgi:hypothetical protein